MFDVCRLCLTDIPEVINKLSYDDYTAYDTKIKLIMPEIVSLRLFLPLQHVRDFFAGYKYDNHLHFVQSVFGITKQRL